MLPVYELTGFDAYVRLFSHPTWRKALINLALFASLYISISVLFGLSLAILIDQRIRAEGLLRPIYLYPMALSFIVTGTAWKWFLNPGFGLERTIHQMGWQSFHFDWLINSDMAIYTVVIAGVWQVVGFVMAMFLAGLRGIDNEIFRAAQVDGASPLRLYTRIIIPMLRPVAFSVVIVLAHMAIKSYDLVIALTGGGPGDATHRGDRFEHPVERQSDGRTGRNQPGVGGVDPAPGALVQRARPDAAGRWLCSGHQSRRHDHVL